MKKIAIIGSGVIGQSWSVVFARANHTVVIYDQDYEASQKALKNIGVMLRNLALAGEVSEESKILSRIAIAKSLEGVLDGSEYVQENVPEQIDVKRDIFSKLDAEANEKCVIASSTSALLPSSFLRDIPRRNRCLVAHPYNPPHLIPLVEIAPSPWTDDASMDYCRTLMESVGQVPVTLHKEITGFIANRLQAAVIHECMALVKTGVASPEDIDKSLQYGLGMRWALMGAFETMDLNSPGGFLEYVGKYGEGFQAFAKQLMVLEPWSDDAIQAIEGWRRRATAVDDLPKRALWRDNMLISLRRLLNITDLPSR